MKLFDIGNETFINLDFVLLIDQIDRVVELVNGDKIHLANWLFDELWNKIKDNVV